MLIQRKTLPDTMAAESLCQESSVARADSSLLNNLDEILRPLLEREIEFKVKQEVGRALDLERSRLEEAMSKDQAKMLLDAQCAAEAETKKVILSLRVANETVAKFQAVPFPTSLMRCNKCGEDLSAGENIHVADQCGAVSSHCRNFLLPC